MTVLSCLPRNRHGFEYRFAGNDNDVARSARDVPPRASWAFTDHPTMAEVIAAETGQ